MTKKELIGVGAFFILLLAFTQFFTYFQWFRHRADSAFLIEAIESIKTLGVPKSSFARSATDLIYGTDLLTAKAEELKDFDFSIKDIYSTESNVLRSHLYLILYPLSLLSTLISPYSLLLLLHNSSFLILPFAVYCFLRFSKISKSEAALVSVVLSLHPAWRYSLGGEFYIDRFFLLFGTLLIWSSFIITKYSKFLCTIGLLITLTLSERFILISGAFLGYLSLLQIIEKKNCGKSQCALFSLSILLCLVALYLMKNITTIHSYSNFLSLSSFLSPKFLTDSQIFKKLGLFCLFNFPLLIFSTRKPLYAILALGTMVPNIFGDIGGGEKVAWGTHYHTIYLPFLFFAFVRNLSEISSRLLRSIIVGIIFFIFFFVDANSWSSYKIDYRPGLQTNYFMQARRWVDEYQNGLYSNQFDNRDALRGAIPVESSVSTIDSAAMALLGGRDLYFFPMGLRDTDYVIMQYVDRGGARIISGCPSYQDVKEQEQINLLILDKLRQFGYDLNRPIYVSPAFVVFGKRK